MIIQTLILFKNYYENDKDTFNYKKDIELMKIYAKKFGLFGLVIDPKKDVMVKFPSIQMYNNKILFTMRNFIYKSDVVRTS